jgi:DNA topoisomerase-1
VRVVLTDREGRTEGAAGGAPPDSIEAARAAGLRYVTDTVPGIRRRRSGRGFVFERPDGVRISDPATLRRIRALVIPPAWTDVWICPDPNGHIQASARDARGRKQYRYHDRWRELRDSNKFDRLVAFGETLPALRARVRRDLGKPGLGRERVLATVVRLLESTLIRVGNEEYARQNDSYGLTTLRNEHVEVQGSELQFRFRAKSGKECSIDLRDRRAAKIVRQCQELPGQKLFEYLNGDGAPHEVTSTDVNEYLREITEQDFTAKDFRTWAATVQVFVALRDCVEWETPPEAKRNAAAAIKSAATCLNNTPAVCRKSYVHPLVLETYLDPEARALLREAGEDTADDEDALDPDERAVLAFLKRRSAA